MTGRDDVDAVVIGAGHHGVVAASILTPGSITDLFSSFYPMTVPSPVIAAGLGGSRTAVVACADRNRSRPQAGRMTTRPVLYRDRTCAAAEFERPHTC
jgi:hypothetical protein